MARKLLLFTLLCLAFVARADEAAIRKAAKALLPEGTTVEGVSKAGFLNLYEVRIAGPDGIAILYADEQGAYFIAGSVLDPTTQSDLTEARLRKLNGTRFEDLPLAQAFKIVRGKGTRQLVYFSDPLCGYCRKLDQELTQVDDVTVHVFMIPIIARDSAAVSKAIWCSPDRSKAWLDLMLKGIQPAAAKADCQAPLDKNLALGRKLGIEATPTLMFSDSRLSSGFKPAAELSKLLDRAAKR
jgi:thiol:disulfide interchange protein DsbC